ncbi:MAG: peptidoglycan editing factor PgeF [Deltaproteobacteria bacterium]|nr:peptidoglycan editing factor PgeF [Deltaproteobacteria bacterium]
MFRFSQRGAIEYLEIEELSELDFLTHAFCTRRGGVSTGPYESLNLGFLAGDRAEDVRRNRILVEEAFGIPNGQLILMRQVHGDRIRVLDGDEPLPEGLPECDGLISDRPGVALAVKTADCVPLFFVDRARRIIGAAHAGWRGTARGIATAMVEILAGRFSSRREDLVAVIGPAIGPCCYQVDVPVFSAFSGRPGADRFLHPCKELGRWMADLALANRLQIREAGVPSENIFSAGLCTACRQDLFFSHRAGGGHAGRQINLLMLKRGG